MKNLVIFLLALMLAACSSGNKEAGSQDSTAMNDTLDVPAMADDESITVQSEDITEVEMSDTSQLEITFDEAAGLVFERMEPFYTVSITTSQYEASSDVTWYFDLDFSPIYFKETWSAEGNEGSTEFFIKDDKVVCAVTQETNDEKKWCYTTGGIRVYYEEEGSGDPLVDLLSLDYGRVCNEELERYLDILKSILNEADQTGEDENTYTFIIAKTSEIGGNEVHESTEITIPKKLYEAIK